MQTILFFDLDATLVENRFSRKAIAPLLQTIADEAEIAIDTVLERMSAENMRRQQQDPDNPLTMDWDDIVQHVAREFEVTLRESVDARWEQVAHADDVEVLDNAPAVLKLLQSGGRKLVLSTKGLSKYQDAVLRVTGLDAFFEDILTPDRTGFLKTSRDYFRNYAAVDALKIQIGDHYYDDVICARDKGYQAIMRAPLDALAVYTPFERPALLAAYRDQIPSYPAAGTDIVPDAVVVSLEELPDVVRQLEQQASDNAN